jgi:hypothetical protein
MPGCITGREASGPTRQARCATDWPRSLGSEGARDGSESAGRGRTTSVIARSWSNPIPMTSQTTYLAGSLRRRIVAVPVASSAAVTHSGSMLSRKISKLAARSSTPASNASRSAIIPPRHPRMRIPDGAANPKPSARSYVTGIGSKTELGHIEEATRPRYRECWQPNAPGGNSGGNRSLCGAHWLARSGASRSSVIPPFPARRWHGAARARRTAVIARVSLIRSA